MSALDLSSLPTAETALSAVAGLLNSLALPAATPASVAAASAAVPCLLALAWLARRLTRRQTRRMGGRASADPGLAARIDDLDHRLKVTELLLADSTSEATQLRQRLDQVTSRQETLAAGTARSGLRQAIALSKHGATTRQLVDTCGLSQGEAHLVQTLYGRAPDAASEGLH